MPLGPLTDTLSLVIDTWTPLGISMGLRPMRDMTHQTSQRTSPPTPLVARLAVGHHALRRGDDGDAEAVADLGTCLAGT